MDLTKPGFFKTIAFWHKLGWISFGGPAGQISIMYQTLVRDKRWLTHERFTQALNFCMLLPGPEAQQLAMFTGWQLHGMKGGILAGILFILPSCLILWFLGILYVTWGEQPLVQSIFLAIQPAIVAVVVNAVLRFSQRSLTTSLHIAVALVSFIALLLGLPFPWVVIGAILLSLLMPFQGTDNEFHPTEKNKSLNNKFFAIAGKQIFVFFVLWTIPIIAVIAFSPVQMNDFYLNVIFFFSKAAFITFGGAYAALPYVAQVSVEQYAWLSSPEMVHALSLGESTPGPLIMVLSFVGFISGFHAGGDSLLTASLAMGLTIYYTFLPGFMFVLVGAPFIERAGSSTKLTKAFRYITAAIIGVIASLAVFLGQHILFTNQSIQILPCIWFLLSLWMLNRQKVPLISWLGVSLFAGIIYHLLVNNANFIL